jgi:hypothetical protein
VRLAGRARIGGSMVMGELYYIVRLLKMEACICTSTTLNLRGNSICIQGE